MLSTPLLLSAVWLPTVDGQKNSANCKSDAADKMCTIVLLPITILRGQRS